MPEYLAWVEYATVEPFGSYFDDLRAGQVAAAIYNVNRDPEKVPDPFKAGEFAAWNALHRRDVAPPDPILLDSPEAQSEAIMRAMGISL